MSISVGSSVFMSWHSIRKLFFPLNHSSCIRGRTHRFWFYSVDCNPLLLLLFKCLLVPNLTPSHWLLCPFGTSPSFIEHFLIFWRKLRSQLQLALSLLHPWNQPFSQGCRVPFSKGHLETKIWALNVLIGMGCHCFSAHSVDRDRKLTLYTCKCVYGYTYTHTHLWLCVYIFTHTQ